MSHFLKSILIIGLTILFVISPVDAARDTDSYDGNIFPIYAGNGSLVPPSSTLEDSLKSNRTSVIVYYLDDSSTSKAFAPVVSALKLVWGPAIDLIPLTTDELSRQNTSNSSDPSFYWHGIIPQIVVIDGEGNVLLDEEGLVPLDTINEAISKATGLDGPKEKITIKSFNEYNSEPAKS